MENPAPSEPRDAAQRRLTLAVLAGLPRNFQMERSRPEAVISGSWEPYGAPPVGHIETVILQAHRGGTSPLRTLVLDLHGCGVASEAFIASTAGWSLKGAGPLCLLLPLTLLSAGAMFPKQSANYFMKARTRESSHTTECSHAASARSEPPAFMCAGWDMTVKLNKKDMNCASLPFSAGTAETVSGGCNITPPPRRHGNVCAAVRRLVFMCCFEFNGSDLTGVWTLMNTYINCPGVVELEKLKSSIIEHVHWRNAAFPKFLYLVLFYANWYISKKGLSAAV